MVSDISEKTKSLVPRPASPPAQAAPARSAKGHFLVGENWTGNRRGRPVGSRNKLAESFLSALFADFQQHGPQAIAEMRVTDPSGYIKTVAALLPREARAEPADQFELMSDDELREFVRDKIIHIAPHFFDDCGCGNSEDAQCETRGLPLNSKSR